MDNIRAVQLVYSFAIERIYDNIALESPELLRAIEMTRAWLEDNLKSKNRSFKCPNCGSSYWGTSACLDWDNAVGHCHDQYNVGCMFKWNRSDDVSSYFFDDDE